MRPSLHPEDGGSMVLRNVGVLPRSTHSVTTQKCVSNSPIRHYFHRTVGRLRWPFCTFLEVVFNQCWNAHFRSSHCSMRCTDLWLKPSCAAAPYISSVIAPAGLPVTDPVHSDLFGWPWWWLAAHGADVTDDDRNSMSETSSHSQVAGHRKYN